jgi:hypothetical protein
VVAPLSHKEDKYRVSFLENEQLIPHKAAIVEKCSDRNQ